MTGVPRPAPPYPPVFVFHPVVFLGAARLGPAWHQRRCQAGPTASPAASPTVEASAVPGAAPAGGRGPAVLLAAVLLAAVLLAAVLLAWAAGPAKVCHRRPNS